MATLAEQNAVRCKEAGNVLYKSERYEEVSSEQYIYVCVRVCVSSTFRSLFIFLSLSFFRLMMQIFSKMRKARLRVCNKRSLSLSSCYALTRAFL
jgi:hypothetical protein